MLRFVGSQRVGHDWANELNWVPGPCSEPSLSVLTSEHRELALVCGLGQFCNDLEVQPGCRLSQHFLFMAEYSSLDGQGTRVYAVISGDM